MIKAKIYIASDHAGYNLKEELVQHIRVSHAEYKAKGMDVEVFDRGPKSLDPEDDFTVDLAPLAGDMAREVFDQDPNNGNSKNSIVRAIVIGDSGQGEAMLMNRFPGIRAAVYYGGSLEIVSLSREHNDANVLSLGARFISTKDAKVAVDTWLFTDFLAKEKYIRRNTALDGGMKA